MLFQSKGKIIYDPTGGNAYDPWWIIIECPNDIIHYYQNWIRNEKGIRLNKPLYGAHISVLRGEEPTQHKKYLWKKYQNEEITFYYDHKVQSNGVHWWLNVYCERLKEIRQELGLEGEIKFDFHLTIGRVR
jgi:hypothetical protein